MRRPSWLLLASTPAGLGRRPSEARRRGARRSYCRHILHASDRKFGNATTRVCAHATGEHRRAALDERAARIHDALQELCASWGCRPLGARSEERESRWRVTGRCAARLSRPRMPFPGGAPHEQRAVGMAEIVQAKRRRRAETGAGSTDRRSAEPSRRRPRRLRRSLARERRHGDRLRRWTGGQGAARVRVGVRRRLAGA